MSATFGGEEQFNLSFMPADAKVLDVGGGLHAHPRADSVLDIISQETCGRQNPEVLQIKTWIQMDICDRTSWPFPDKYFDYAICSHTLEDIRDPIWVCSEMSRVAKRGYIECPSRAIEQSVGIESPLYAGYYHHRWLVDVEKGGLSFRIKPHNIAAFNECVVSNLMPGQCIAPQCARLSLEWADKVSCREIIETSEKQTLDELASTANRFREIKGLKVRKPVGNLKARLGKSLFYWKTRLLRNTAR